MDTVSFVLSTLAALVLVVLALVALSVRLWYALRIAQFELVHQEALMRPRSPQAEYDTGLVER